MTSATLDHMISLIIFMAAILIFVGFFSQTMQTGIAYQRNTALSTKASDLLETMLLNPGLPTNWGQSDNPLIDFGLQDPSLSQYKLSHFSPMRLISSTQSPVYYPRTGEYYRNITAGLGSYLLGPSTKSVNYSTVSNLMGINGTYGFRLTLSPTISVSIEKISVGAPMELLVRETGTGYPLANAPLSYSLLLVNEDGSEYPSHTITNGESVTDAAGSVKLSFPGIDGESQTYALIVYSYLDGVEGIGYYVHVPQSFTKSMVPLIDSFQDRRLLIAHGDSVGEPSEDPSYPQLNYNASFVILTEDYTLRQVPLDQPTAVGQVVYGSATEQDYASITLPNSNGVLIVTYKGTEGATVQYGLVLAPWGLGSMAFPLTFGGNPEGQDWVTTDIRQVTIGGIAYHAKIELWSLQGYSRSS